MPHAELASLEDKIFEPADVVDLVTGENLYPGVIPESLRNDPELSRGYDFLKEHGSQLHVELLLNHHRDGDSLSRSGFDLHEKALETARNNGVLFMEEIGTSAGIQERVQIYETLSQLSPKQGAEVRSQLEELPDASTFQMTRMRQIVATGARVAFPDFLIDSPRPADQAMTRMYEKVRRAELAVSKPENPDQLYAALDIAYNLPSFTAYRDWYFVGKIGNHLAELAAQDPNHEFPTDIKFLVGANHHMVGDHFAATGAEVELTGTVEAEERANVMVGKIGSVLLQNQLDHS